VFIDAMVQHLQRPLRGGRGPPALAMPSFVDNFLMQLQPVREQGMLFGPVTET
jgi:hypothetical protein